MRVRARFSKVGKVRFVSHRDVARVWERTLRRVEIPVAYSGGFSPRPRLHFGLALSVGHESMAEYLDIDMVNPMDDAELSALPARLSDALPAGMACSAVAVVADGDKLSLQEAVTSCTWAFVLDGGMGREAEAAVAALLAAETVTVTRERKGKTHTDDIRPYVRSLELDAASPLGQDAGTGVLLRGEIGTQPRGLRPVELIGALGPQWREHRVCRLAQWIDHEGGRREPLPLADDAPSWQRTTACAT